jgi:hypothetical protein
MSYLKCWRHNRANVNSLALSSSSSDDELTQEFHAPASASEVSISNTKHSRNLPSSDSDDTDYEYLDKVLSDLETDSNTSEVDSEEEEESQPFSAELASWATESHCTRANLNKLLVILRKQGLPLPKDARTLLQTPRTVEALEKCGGQYVYFAVETGILKIISRHPKFRENCYDIQLLVNIDGVPLFKSSGTQFLPIMCSFSKFEPFLVALFYGKSKPTCVEDFLRDFLEEMDSLKENGITFDGKTFQVSLFSFVCDAPARSFLKCIKGHTGYNSCERCIIPGFYQNRRMIFYSSTAFPSRTDDDFNNMLYPDHQKGRSPLTNHNIPCVSGFCLDYMHLVCLGVVKRILWYLKQGPRHYVDSLRDNCQKSPKI